MTSRCDVLSPTSADQEPIHLRRLNNVLTVAYSTGFVMLACSLLAQLRPGLKAALSWTSAVAILLFAVTLVAAVIRLIGRTDAAEAAEAFAASRISGYQRLGRKLGRQQAHALELNERLESNLAIQRKSEPMAGERSEIFFAERRGIFRLNEHKLDNLLSHSDFRNGMRLKLLHGIGTVVPERQPILGLIPGRDQDVSTKLVRRAKRCVVLSRSNEIEEVSSATVALTGLAIGLAKAGDRGTAHQVARTATRLVEAHVDAARHARKRQLRRQLLRANILGGDGSQGLRAARATATIRVRDEEVAPVVPALRDVVTTAVRARGDDRGSLDDIPGIIIGALLDSTGIAEATGAMVAFALPDEPTAYSGDIGHLTSIARRVGIRALENNDRSTWDRVLEWLDRVAKHKDWHGTAVTTVGQLAATACWFDPRHANVAIGHLSKLTTVEPDTAASVYSMWRVGATAMAAGAFSTMVLCARVTVERKHHQVIAKLVTSGKAEAEGKYADLFGGYLGNAGADALVSFSDILRELEPAL